MKNKLFWPIVLISIVIIVESVLLLTRNRVKTPSISINNGDKTPTTIEEKKPEAVLAFSWTTKDGKTVLEMKADRDVAIDAIDLYVSYKDVKINSVTNVGDLPKPTFSKVSEDKSLIVMNYLISAPEGFKMTAGQTVGLVLIDSTAVTSDTAQFSIDPSKTKVVENGTSKVLPYL